MHAVIYAAKSTEDKKGSIARQLKQCREMAEREGWQRASEHEDEDISGYRRSRGPGLEAARAQAEKLAPCVLLVHHSDRLARGDAVQGAHLSRERHGSRSGERTGELGEDRQVGV